MSAVAWDFRRGRVAAGIERAEIVGADGEPPTWATFLEALRDDATVRAALTAGLASAPHAAFFWEMPALTAQTLDRRFESVLVAAPSLAGIAADPTPFEDQFATAGSDDVIVFPNLDGDATLVVPCPSASRKTYAHLATFVRGAPADQLDRFWTKLGHAIAAALSPAPLWVSTAGLGVAWLHMRLDSRPKYYRHGPYKQALP